MNIGGLTLRTMKLHNAWKFIQIIQISSTQRPHPIANETACAPWRIDDGVQLQM